MGLLEIIADKAGAEKMEDEVDGVKDEVLEEMLNAARARPLNDAMVKVHRSFLIAASLVLRKKLTIQLEDVSLLAPEDFDGGGTLFEGDCLCGDTWTGSGGGSSVQGLTEKQREFLQGAIEAEVEKAAEGEAGFKESLEVLYDLAVCWGR